MLGAVVVACGGEEQEPAGGSPGAPGAPGAPAAEHGDGGTENSSVTGIVPPAVLVDRAVTVVISGNDTDWSTAPLVDFGQGVVVDEVIAASATSLVVKLHATEDALPGVRAVTVGGHGYAGFRVEPALRIAPALGTLNNGSGAYFRVASPPGEAFGGVPEFTFAKDGVVYARAEGVHTGAAQLRPITDNDYLLAVYADLDVADGDYDVIATIRHESEILAPPHTFRAPRSLRVHHREPTAVAAFPVPVSYAGTSLLEGTTLRFNAPSTGQPECTASHPGAPAGFMVNASALGPSGTWGDRRLFFLAGEPVNVTFLTNFDPSQPAPGPVQANLTCTITPMVISTGAEPNETSAEASNIGATPVAIRGSIASDTDVDWYSFTLAASAQRGIRIAPARGRDTFVVKNYGTSNIVVNEWSGGPDDFGTTHYVNFAIGTNRLRVEAPQGQGPGEYELWVD